MIKARCFLILFFLFLGLFWACLVVAQDQSPAQEQDSEQRITDFSLSGFGAQGKKTWELSGQSADIFSDVVRLKDVTGKVYGKQEDITLTAERGNFDKSQGKVRLEKDVVITSSGGAKLTTDYLDWDRDKQLVMTEALVNIERNNMITTATGATCKTDLNKVNLQKDVKVEIKPQGTAGEPSIKDRIVITCDGPMEIDYAKNIAIFNKNVKVSQKDMNLYSDVMEVYFITSGKDEAKSEGQAAQDAAIASPISGGKIEKIIAKGNVKIERGENVSYSDEAVFTAADKKVVLLGKPRLIFYSQEDLNASFGN